MKMLKHHCPYSGGRNVVDCAFKCEAVTIGSDSLARRYPRGIFTLVNHLQLVHPKLTNVLPCQEPEGPMMDTIFPRCFDTSVDGLLNFPDRQNAMCTVADLRHHRECRFDAQFSRALRAFMLSKIRRLTTIGRSAAPARPGLAPHKILLP